MKKMMKLAKGVIPMGYAKGGKVKEGAECYPNKAAMKKHEAAESKKTERKEQKRK